MHMHPSSAAIHQAISRQAHNDSVGDGISLQRRKRKERKKTEGTPQNVYAKWIRGEIDREAACLELPFTVMLLMSFATLAISYVGQDTVNLVEYAIVTDILENANFAWAYHFGHKGIDDVNSYADFWSWTRLGFYAIATPADYWYSEGLAQAVGQDGYDSLPTKMQYPGYLRPAPIRNDYLRYNRIIGGIRFRQQVSEPAYDKCQYVPGTYSVIQEYLGKKCTGLNEYELPPDQFATETLDDPQRIEWLLSDVESHETLVQRLLDMEDGCVSAHAQNRTCLCVWCAENDHPWLNELTQRIEISFVSFNAQYGIYSMTVVNFWFNRAGHIHKFVNIRSTWAGLGVRDTSVLVVFLGSGMLWMFASLYVFRTEGWEIVDQIRRKHKPWYLTLMDDYLSFWNCIDWVSIVIASIILGLFMELQFQVVGVSESLFGLAQVSYAVSGTMPEVSLYKNSTETFYDQVENCVTAERHFRFWLSIYPMVLMMRLFKSFAAQPRLAIVTETFKHAANDMFHFFIVFASVYFCMGVNAVLFFGQDSLHFSRLDWALFSCWRAMQGDWDWEDLNQIGREKAFIWFFLFMLVMVLILMNILVSILMESYAAVKSAAEGADSLFAQIMNMLRRARETREGKRVRLQDIEDALLLDSEQDEQAMFNNPRPLLPQFKVVLDRSDGSPLGIDFVPANSVLLVQGIEGGLIEAWNSHHIMLEVRVGDSILEVNGVRGEAGLLIEEMNKKKELRIRLRRCQADQDATATLKGMRRSSSRRRSSMGSPSGQPTRTRSKRIASFEPAFLMDMVQGIPEQQAKRTLKNSLAADSELAEEDLEPESLEGEIGRIMERVGNSILCSGWLHYKLEEYDLDDKEKAAVLKASLPPAEEEEAGLGGSSGSGGGGGGGGLGAAGRGLRELDQGMGSGGQYYPSRNFVPVPQVGQNGVLNYTTDFLLRA